ncbi:helix-turn-helix transcriptional regulator [Vibrio harveyi]
MFFHKVKSQKVTLKPYRTKRSLIIRASNYSGVGCVNGEEIRDFDNGIIVIPKGALIECNLTKEGENGRLEIITLNRFDEDYIKHKLARLSDIVLNSETKKSFIISKSEEYSDIFTINRELNRCARTKAIRNVALRQSVFHIMVKLKKEGKDVGILFKSEDQILLSERLAKLFIEEPCKKWTLTLASQILFTSSSSLRRNLSKEDASFSQILNDVRLGISLNYLTFTNHNILKVSELSGFNSSAYFCTTFKKRYGITPQVFRINSRKNNK